MNWKLWRWPIVLGLITLIGLVAGLVSDGAGDWIAWVGLGVPVGACVWFSLRRSTPR